MNKDCVAPNASPGVARSARKASRRVEFIGIKASCGAPAWSGASQFRYSSLRDSGRTRRPPQQQPLTVVILIT